MNTPIDVTNMASQATQETQAQFLGSLSRIPSHKRPLRQSHTGFIPPRLRRCNEPHTTAFPETDEARGNNPCFILPRIPNQSIECVCTVLHRILCEQNATK